MFPQCQYLSHGFAWVLVVVSIAGSYASCSDSFLAWMLIVRSTGLCGALFLFVVRSRCICVYAVSLTWHVQWGGTSLLAVRSFVLVVVFASLV